MSLSEKQAENISAQGADPELWRRYAVPPGRIMLQRDAIDVRDEYLVASKVTDRHGRELALVNGDSNKATIARMFQPWAKVLMIGGARPTEYGTLVQPPDVKEGERVLIAPTGGRDVEIGNDEQQMFITVIPFEGILLIDHGEGS